jgi:pyridoxamine 5'-phosphate oxidase
MAMSEKLKLDQARREYLKGGLRREQLNANPIIQLQSWLEDAAELGVIDATAMSLATVNAEGQPSQRIVLLKQLDHKGLVFYTNLKSRKAQDIAVNQKVSTNFAWLPLERQVKIQGIAKPISHAESLKYFLSRPKDSQLAAWASKQSHPIGSRKLLNHAFEQMKHKFAQGEVPLPDFWGGYRIEPTGFEFWQGGGARLHDSFKYVAENNGWVIQRLAP